tara:strand:+ start:213 stop:608 length:396 start_codon:yes stop_codon:yes gene_type:complete
MKTIYLFLALTFTGFKAPPKHLLKVNFNGLSTNEGQILVKIVNEKNEKISGHKIRVKDLSAELSVELTSGSYAISAFHDINNDDKLNTNALGIPTEKYGFSNNARGWFGPPELSEQLVKINGDMKINISLK